MRSSNRNLSCFRHNPSGEISISVKESDPLNVMQPLSFRTIKRIGAIAFALVLLFLGQQIFLPEKASAQLDARLSRLESEVTLLRSSISRLETSLSRVDRGNIPALPTTPRSDRPPTYRSDDPMFDRLATLAIELRERIDNLEGRVSALEHQRS